MSFEDKKKYNNLEIVYLSDVIFKGRRTISWKKVEQYLKRYDGVVVKVKDTGDDIHINRDFADEFANSVYTRSLKGGFAKVKANIVQIIPDLVFHAKNKRWREDFGQKYKKKAEYGWYRYDIRFGVPVYDNMDTILRYNIYRGTLLVRCASDKKMYLYDIQNIKKKRATHSRHLSSGQKLAS